MASEIFFKKSNYRCVQMRILPQLEVIQSLFLKEKNLTVNNLVAVFFKV